MVSEALKPLVHGRTRERVLLLARLEKLAMLVIGHQLADPRAEIARRAALDILQVQCGFRAQEIRSRKMAKYNAARVSGQVATLKGAVLAKEREWANGPEAEPVVSHDPFQGVEIP